MSAPQALSNPPSKPPSRRGSFALAPQSPNHRASRTNSPHEEDKSNDAATTVVTSPNPIVRGGRQTQQAPKSERSSASPSRSKRNKSGGSGKRSPVLSGAPEGHTDGDSELLRHAKPAEPLSAPDRDASVRNDTRAEQLNPVVTASTHKVASAEPEAKQIGNANPTSAVPPSLPTTTTASHSYQNNHPKSMPAAEGAQSSKSIEPTSKPTTLPDTISTSLKSTFVPSTAPTSTASSAQVDAPSVIVPKADRSNTTAPPRFSAPAATTYSSTTASTTEPLYGPGRRRPSEASAAPSVRPSLSAISGLERVAAIPKLQGSSGRLQERVGTCVHNLMAVKCPERLGHYPEIMRQYEGKEEQLLDALQTVFGDEYFFGKRPNVGHLTSDNVSLSATRRRSQSPHTTDLLTSPSNHLSQPLFNTTSNGSIPRTFDRGITFGQSIINPSTSVARSAQSIASSRSGSIMTPPLPRDLYQAAASHINASYGVPSRTSSASNYM